MAETVTGNDYLKSPVSENYSLDAVTARWNISDVRKTTLVLKDGVVYRPAELDSALGVEP